MTTQRICDYPGSDGIFAEIYTPEDLSDYIWSEVNFGILSPYADGWCMLLNKETGEAEHGMLSDPNKGAPIVNPNFQKLFFVFVDTKIDHDEFKPAIKQFVSELAKTEGFKGRFINVHDGQNIQMPLIKISKPKPAQKPTPGRIVIYNTTQDERDIMEANGDNVQTQLPALIVSVPDISKEIEDGECNLTISIDGLGPDLWKPSVLRGSGEGQWNWPVIK